MFNDMLGDVIAVQKPDGQLFENINASVQGNKIYILDIELPLEENDRIFRTLPNGLIEVYIVLDRGFIKDPFGDSMSLYEAKVKRENTIKESQYESYILNFSGNARLNINSTDNSINSIGCTDLFEILRQELQEIKDEVVKSQAIKMVDDLEKAQGKPTFANLYMKFMGIIADHVTLAIPVIQALTGLLC